MYESRDQLAIQKRLQSELAKTELDALILVQPESIFYATGYASQLLYLSNNIGLTFAIVPKEGPIFLICNEFERQAALSVCKNVEIVSYPVWIYIEDFADPNAPEKEPQPDLNKTFMMAADIIRGKYAKARVGTETERLSHSKYMFLEETFGRGNLTDCSEVLIKARMIKTAWEVDVLRRATQIAEVAMNRTARIIVPGMTEADVKGIFNIECQKQSPDVLQTIHAHTIGKDFAPSVISRHNRFYLGDIVRLDGGPLYCGYGADISRTYVLGNTVAPERERIYGVLYEAYVTGISMIKPGVKMSDVFHAVQGFVQTKIPGFKRGHYGHSIGCNRFTEEYPFIAANNNDVFMENMVFCLEVPYYSSKNHSYNVEDTFLVTEDGIELFSHVNPSLHIS